MLLNGNKDKMNTFLYFMIRITRIHKKIFSKNIDIIATHSNDIKILEALLLHYFLK